MIELGPGADLFRMFGAFLWIALFSAIIAALWIPHSWFGKLVGLSLVLGFFVLLPGRSAWLEQQRIDAFKAQSARAWAHFEERCKNSGEFIHRTVDGVEGLFLGEILSWTAADLRDANAQNIYNRDLSGEDYILSFLAGQNASGLGITYGHIVPSKPMLDANKHLIPAGIVRHGYQWVEAIDPKEGQRYRYTGEFERLQGSTTAVDLVAKRQPATLHRATRSSASTSPPRKTVPCGSRADCCGWSTLILEEYSQNASDTSSNRDKVPELGIGQRGSWQRKAPKTCACPIRPTKS